MSDTSIRKKAVHAFAWYGGSRVIVQAFSWAMTLVVARLVAPGDYGLLGMALLVIGLVDFINELGFGAAIVQRKEIEAEDLNTLFWFGLGTSLLLYGLTMVASPWIAQFFNQPKLTALLRLMGVYFLITALRSVPWNMLTREVDFKRRSIAEMIGNLAGAIVTVVLAYNGWGVWALAWGMLTPNTVMTMQVFAQTGWRPQWRFNRACLKRHLGFSLNVVGSRVAWYLQDNSATFIIGKFLGDQALGFYTLATRIGMELSGRVLSIINQVAFPLYSRLQDDPHRLKGCFLNSMQLVSAVLFPISAGLFLVADDLLPLLLTSKWSPMILPVKILCWAGLLKTIETLGWPAVLAKGKAGVVMKFNVACVVILPLSFWIGTHWGLSAVCYVWLTVFPLLVAYWLIITKPIIGFSWGEFANTLRPSALSMIAMLTVVAVGRMAFIHLLPPIVRLIVTVLLGTAAYAGSFALIFRRDLREILALLWPGKFPMQSTTAYAAAS